MDTSCNDYAASDGMWANSTPSAAYKDVQVDCDAGKLTFHLDGGQCITMDLNVLKRAVDIAARGTTAESGQSANSSGSAPGQTCRGCSRRSECMELCDDVRMLLDSPLRGRGKRENLSGLHEQTLDGVPSRWRTVFESYVPCMDLLTERQYQVVVLHLFHGFTQKDTAKKLGLCVSTVNDHLQRAKRVRNDFYSRR